MKNFVRTGLLSALLLVASQAGNAQVAVGIRIGPPPPLRAVAVVPAQPGPDFVWVGGYWYPVGGHYRWHAGYWSRPPYSGARWVGPRHDGERFYGGYWEGERGRVEHDHRWDHDHDRRDHDRFRDHGHDHDDHH